MTDPTGQALNKHLTKLRDDEKLTKLIEASRKRVAEMTPEEREAMHKAQRESWARAESGPDW